MSCWHNTFPHNWLPSICSTVLSTKHLREPEVSCQLCRLNASHKAAEKYISQFPSPGLSAAAKLVSYVAGSFCALFIFLAFCDAVLLERPLYGQNLVW